MSAKLKKELRRMIVALAIYLAMLIVDKTGLLPQVFENRLFSLCAYLIPYFISGAPVVRKALLGVRNLRPLDESFLMFIATIGAFATGENSEACAVMLFYQVGEWFQDYAVDRSRKSITELMDIVPESANLEKADGSIEVIDPDDVMPGDILVIRPGERIPVDATVLTGHSMINTAALTGEPVPRAAGPEDQVISGCVNGEGLLRVRADKGFEDSTVSRVLEMVEEASERKSHREAFITRFARYYTPIVVGAAAALAVIPSIITGEWSVWIYRACTFLVISCPCALVISVPLAFFAGVGAASSNGVLVKGSNYLEILADLDTVVSDKTGTLTEGDFAVSRVLPAEGYTNKDVLRTAAAAEGSSTHPIAKSIVSAFRAQVQDASAVPEPVSDVTNISGKGLAATAAGSRILVGNGRLMQDEGVAFTEVDAPQSTVCHVARDGTFVGTILIEDEIKPEAAEAVAGMKKAGVRNIVMLTGDRREVGEYVGAKLGLDTVMSELMPQDKVFRVEDLLEDLKASKGRKTLAFIGDGINDAPVLSRADVGIAMGSMGSDAAIEAADVVIMDDDLRRIPAVMRIAKKTVRLSSENIVFAIGVKVAILILAALGLANMWAAVFGDVGVAFICICNSMRLLVRKKEYDVETIRAQGETARAMA